LASRVGAIVYATKRFTRNLEATRPGGWTTVVYGLLEQTAADDLTDIQASLPAGH
jgi:hypothetical protein